MSKLPDLLLHLCRSHGDGAATRDDFDFCGQKVKFKDLCLLSDDLFKHLHVKFELLFSALRDLSESGSRQVPELRSKLWKIVKDLMLVLRCCLIILTLLESEQQSLLKKCRYICQILKIFSSVDVNGRTQITFESLASCESSASSAERSIPVSFELCDPCRPFLHSVLEAARNKTSHKVASEFHKIWARHSRMNTPSSFQQGMEDNEAEDTRTLGIINPFSYGLEEETCNGEMFLECIVEKSRMSDYDDLMDFIECKRGKDYHAWLKNREIYRRWKRNKVYNMRKRSKKMLRKVLRCSKISRKR